jgi:hypothetical protein
MIPAVSSQLLLLVLMYALLAFLLLCLCLATRWHWGLKAAMVVLVSGFYVLVTDAAGHIGWPSDDALPKRFVLLAAVFDEPSPARDHPAPSTSGSTPRRQRTAEMPRVHRLPYEKDLHRILGDGIKKAREGNTQMGSTEPKRGQGGLAWLLPASNDKVEIKLTDLPRAQLPEK